MNIEGLRLLLVEDEAIIGFALEDLLSAHGARTTLVANIASARQRLAQDRFDAAIVDVNLNGEFSYPLADEIRATGCPMVFATGYGYVTHPDHLIDTPTVEKPYSLDALLAALSRAMRDHAR